MKHKKNLAGLFCFFASTSTLAAFPADYKGQFFDDAAYRQQQAVQANLPKSPYRAFSPALTVWQSKTPTGKGWVGDEEANARIFLDAPDAEGKQFIHYHIAVNNYRYFDFGWQWTNTESATVDMNTYDAVGFSIKVTGEKKPQEMFFGVSKQQPAPLALSEYDPDFADGNWHRITIPISHMKWTTDDPRTRETNQFVFKTFVWNVSEFDVQLDNFTLERANNTAALPQQRPTQTKPATAPLHHAVKAQVIPGKIEAAFYDVGGEGVAYHDTTPINILSGVLNQVKNHQRPHATAYEWNFRKDEAVDISFTKDWADLNHPNLFDIGANQLYIGGTENGEWTRYTVDVKKAGTYKISAAYGNSSDGEAFSFSVDDQAPVECKVPSVTGNMHKWNKAEVGSIRFPKAGKHVLTLHYGRGFNLAFFEFVAAE